MREILQKVERKKDETDLRSTLVFVERNREAYERGMKKFMARHKTISGVELAERVHYPDEDQIVGPQVSSAMAKEIFSRMPECLAKLSRLKHFSYQYAGEVIVPLFDSDGNFISHDWVSYEKFMASHLHPSRVMVGFTTEDAHTVYPSVIPPTVSKDAESVRFYQIHTSLHEFFHTVEFAIREKDEERKIVFECDGKQFTFRDWIEDFAKVVTSSNEPEFISDYGEVYKNQLANVSETQKFRHALAEQVCESFVAYQLGLVPNKEQWTDFRSHAFKNLDRERKFIEGLANSANLKWELMDRLCRANLLSAPEPANRTS